MDRKSMNIQDKQVSPADSALASELFDRFCNANTLKTILGYHRQLCDTLNLKPNHFPAFYPKLRQYVNSWRAKALWKKFDLRASHKCYARGKACPNTRVLIVGAGPCGLRTAIEAQLLGAKVVVVEKRDRMSRNNVLHLWPFVIEDLRGLGAKKFFGKFCAGAIDHISIRQLQCILLKVALLLGVEIHTEVSFMKLLPPPSKEESHERNGWRGSFSPVDHPISQYEFDVLIGADGRRNTLEGFNRKEFRGRLAIAITANFINKRTEAEARVEEISGVAFIFNQKFFKELYEATGIDLENIVYYKDDTHYFVMTAKKQSLLEKGVILNDIADTSKLLARENVDVEALQEYAREAADFSTQYQMPDLQFAVNHYGNPDVNMFDFTSMYAAENASKVLERNGHRLLMSLVGDSLLEPFWPTGSGCARGFLSSMDACWAIRGWGSGTMTPLEILAERESIYRLLGQTTPENLQRDSKSYTLDPSSRYPNLVKSSLSPSQVTNLFDTDDPGSVKAMITASTVANSGVQELHKKRRRKDSQVHPDTLLHWLKRQIVQYEDLVVEDLTGSFKDGLVLCAVIHRYRPDLLDFQSLKKENVARNNQLAFDILERELSIPPVMTGQEMADCSIPDLLTMLSYLTQIYDTFRGEIPHIKQPKLPVKIQYSLVDSQSFLEELDFIDCINKRLNTNSNRDQTPSEPMGKFIDKTLKKMKSHTSRIPIRSQNNPPKYNEINKTKLNDNNENIPIDTGGKGDHQEPEIFKKQISLKSLIAVYNQISCNTEKKIAELEAHQKYEMDYVDMKALISSVKNKVTSMTNLLNTETESEHEDLSDEITADTTDTADTDDTTDEKNYCRPNNSSSDILQLDSVDSIKSFDIDNAVNIDMNGNGFDEVLTTNTAADKINNEYNLNYSQLFTQLEHDNTLYPIPEEDENDNELSVENYARNDLLYENFSNSSSNEDQSSSSDKSNSPFPKCSTVLNLCENNFDPVPTPVTNPENEDLPELKTLDRPVQPKDFAFVPRVNISAGPTPNPRFAMKHREHRRYGDHTHGQMLNSSTDQAERRTRKRRSVDKVGASLVLLYYKYIPYVFKFFYFSVFFVLFEYIRIKYYMNNSKP